MREGNVYRVSVERFGWIQVLHDDDLSIEVRLHVTVEGFDHALR
jgi:hypothetical protein